MSFYSGSDGQLIYAPQTAEFTDGKSSGEQVIAKVRNWSYTSTTASLDTTTLGDTDRTLRHGIRSASGNAEILYYNDQPNDMANAGTLIREHLRKQDNPQFHIKFKIGRGTSDVYYAVYKCLITSMTINMAVGEVTSVNISFDLNDAPVAYRL